MPRARLPRALPLLAAAAVASLALGALLPPRAAAPVGPDATLAALAAADEPARARWLVRTWPDGTPVDRPWSVETAAGQTLLQDPFHVCRVVRPAGLVPWPEPDKAAALIAEVVRRQCAAPASRAPERPVPLPPLARPLLRAMAGPRACDPAMANLLPPSWPGETERCFDFDAARLAEEVARVVGSGPWADEARSIEGMAVARLRPGRGGALELAALALDGRAGPSGEAFWWALYLPRSTGTP